MKDEFDSKDLWRVVILFGLNVATYKIALAKCLYNFTIQGKSKVSMEELAQEFFYVYKDRLKNNMPQLDNPGRQTKMEHIIKLFNISKVSEVQAIDFVKNNAFVDVVPRFHTVNQQTIPISFYKYDNSGLILTDDLYKVFDGDKNEQLLYEVGSRWDLLEGAFQMKRDKSSLANDVRLFYLERGHERKSLTGTTAVLNGYQKDSCFYCGESMVGHSVHVDHVIPRQVLQHDEIWNLVLAHSFCNSQKSDALPETNYINRLIERNEHFIDSNHPIKNQLIKTMGRTRDLRTNYVYKVYSDVKLVIPYTWGGIKGYNPEKDEFYKSVIRSIHRW